MGFLSSGDGRAGAAEERSASPSIIQAASVERATAVVQEQGASVTHRLLIIDAVGAELTPAQRGALEGLEAIRLYPDRLVEAAGVADPGGKPKGRGAAVPQSSYPIVVGASEVHDDGITGRGIGIAVVDTGHEAMAGILHDTNGDIRVSVFYDAIKDVEEPGVYCPPVAGNCTWAGDDFNGQGTHVSGIILNSERKRSNAPTNGIAPDATSIAVQAFDGTGSGTYLNVIRAIDWIVANRDEYGIRVINCSFSAPVASWYWDDPLNQAVMAAWEAGIVVVASAGNLGPDPMTIGVPGNVPYTITVGAMTDNYSRDDSSDDMLAYWSAAGRTLEAFVKPELTAPGGHLQSPMAIDAQIALDHPEFHDQGSYFTMSGTSQAAAVVSGVAALLLESEPWLSPDDVECRLMSTAKIAVHETGPSPGTLKYSPFQQGAGRVDAYSAIYGTFVGCGNGGLNVGLDLMGIEHYLGPARMDLDGNYFIIAHRRGAPAGAPMAKTGAGVGCSGPEENRLLGGTDGGW